MIELYLLMAFIIIAAIIAAENHTLLSSVISLGAVGLGLCIMFLLLGAPELAITQLVVEILVLIVLVRATIGISVPETYKGREFLSYMMSIIFIVIFLAGSYLSFISLPGFGHPIMRAAKIYIEKGAGLSGQTNLVNAILLNFRRLDLIGMLALVFTAVAGTLVILRSKGRK
ncbi:MAG: hydrogenase subunit MbhD domain-containing protein [bacterium]